MKRIYSCVFIAFALAMTNGAYSQEVTNDTVRVQSTENLLLNKEEKNRNEMLNAESSPGPRNVNIGLPFSGDITILENGLPVVYTFYPTIPTMAWRYDNSLSKMGMMSFSESAITTGKVGYAIQSSDRDASSSFRGFASVYGNSHGSSRYDMTVTGPIKNGWGYMLSFYQSFDRGNGINFEFTPWYDRATNVKGGISKKYNGGSVRVLYKYNNVKSLMSNYQPLIYKGNGKTKELDGFKLGGDSYVLGSGMIPAWNPITGETYTGDLDSDKHSLSESHTIYFDGNHRFRGDFLKGWKLDYSAMYQNINSPFSVTFPVSLMAQMPDQQGNDKYYYHGTNNRYEGNIQWVMTNLIPQSDNKYFTARAELTKKTSNHDFRIGLNYQNYKRKYEMYAGMYAQTVEPNPQLLDLYSYIPAYDMDIKMSSDNGVFPAAYSGSYGLSQDEHTTKMALYASDTYQITRNWGIDAGFRIENQNISEIRYPNGYDVVDGRNVPEIIEGMTPIKHKFKNDWNYVLAANTILKITPKFGLLAEASINSYVESYWDYENRDDMGDPLPDENNKLRRTSPQTNRINVVNLGGGIYFNLGSQLSIVSKITRIKKESNYFTDARVTNPANSSESQNFDPLFYDISTLGWTTDIVASPIKNFNIHFLLTLQKPEYKNFSYSAFGVMYDYNNKIIPELSQVLIEIDPSYTFMGGKMRGWVSLRYFGKQYGNPTNAFYYNARWENFCGLDYNISRNLGLKLQVTNFLDQSGVKGAVQGANQITDATPYTDRIVVANGIRPRTIELTANIKF